MRHEVAPLRHDTMRERNLTVVLGEIARRQPVSRARLAEATGFTKTTVSSLVATLGGAGLVREDGPVRDGERGRPATAVSVNAERVAGLGLEINVDYLAACVLDLGRRIRHRHIVAASNQGRPPERVVAALTDLAARAIAAAGAQGLSVAGAVVALPGALGPGGRLRTAPNLGWNDVAAGELLNAGLPPLPLPAHYDNEANLAALGELWFGDGPELGSYVHVSGEIGVGAGIVVDGRVFRGAHGFAGELGHVVVDPGGPPCACGGRGCLEQVAGQEAILRAAGMAGATATSSAGPDGPLSALVARLESGDERALAAVRRAGESLGQALGAAVNLLDPDTIVFGGIFSALAPWARPAAEAALANAAGVLRGSPPRVTVSRLGGDAAALGAASLVVEHVLNDPARLVGVG
jgi:predicted NBD/HSP70 family sugar kinase